MIAQRIIALVADQEGEWVATLSCGHHRHVRHRPPLVLHPWILDADAREEHLGLEIECGCCQRLERPSELAPYRSTRVFNEHTLPAALQRVHTTKEGVWGLIEVSDGCLRYVVPAIGHDQRIEAGEVGVVPPTIEHRVDIVGSVRVQVTFLRLPCA